jgi:hypothetical protein
MAITIGAFFFSQFIYSQITLLPFREVQVTNQNSTLILIPGSPRERLILEEQFGRLVIEETGISLLDILRTSRKGPVVLEFENGQLLSAMVRRNELDLAYEKEIRGYVRISNSQSTSNMHPRVLLGASMTTRVESVGIRLSQEALVIKTDLKEMVHVPSVPDEADTHLNLNTEDGQILIGSYREKPFYYLQSTQKISSPGPPALSTEVWTLEDGTRILEMKGMSAQERSFERESLRIVSSIPVTESTRKAIIRTCAAQVDSGADLTEIMPKLLDNHILEHFSGIVPMKRKLLLCY